MKFLNKQEQVIDIQMTPYGKYLTSIGKFKPVYYAFFDDGILYDSNYAYGPQSQNDIQKRIKTDTPQLEGQYNFRGVESEVRKANTFIRSQHEWESRYFIDRTLRPPDTLTDTQYALQSIIGTSDLNSIYAPAWDVKLLIGTVSSSARTTSWTKELTGSVINIPQVNVSDLLYQTTIKQVLPNQIIEDRDSEIYGSNDDGMFGEYIDVFSYQEGLLLDIGEENVEFEKEGYEIEVYEIQEEKIAWDPKYPRIAARGGTRENLIPLYFIKYPERIKDGILLDQESYIEELEGFESEDFELDPSYVEYFLEIDVDNEIDKDVLCKLASDQTLGIYSTRFLDCEEADKKREIDARNIYSTDISEEDLKDC